jgi:hypothetical protein
MQLRWTEEAANDLERIADYLLMPDLAGLDFINRNLETAKRAVKAGVKFAMGSDGGATALLGETTEELAWFVKAGMTPAQALATATTNGAAMLGKETELGKLAARSRRAESGTSCASRSTVLSLRTFCTSCASCRQGRPPASSRRS